MSNHGWKHDDLAADLAAHLRGYARPAMIWTDMQLGPMGSARPDVYSIEPTYSRFVAMAYEVKISRADFLSDVTSGKALRYLEFAGSLVYATPKGMVRKDEIPDGCGLIERSDTGWRYAKKPKVNPVQNLPRDAWMKLLIDGVHRCQMIARDPQARQANPWKQEELARKMLGDELAKLMRDRQWAKHSLEQDIEQLRKEREATAEARNAERQRQIGAANAELANIRAAIAIEARGLGLPDDASSYDVRQALQRLRPDADRQALIGAAATLRRHAQWQLREAEEMEAAIRQDEDPTG